MRKETIEIEVWKLPCPICGEEVEGRTKPDARSELAEHDRKAHNLELTKKCVNEGLELSRLSNLSKSATLNG